jgi:molecular chaperone HtpG
VYNLVVNTNSPLATTILNNTDSQEHLEKAWLAKLSQNLLKGEALTAFVKEVWNDCNTSIMLH